MICILALDPESTRATSYQQQKWSRNYGTPDHRASIEPVCNPFTHSNLLPWQRVVPVGRRHAQAQSSEAMNSMFILSVFDGV